MSLNIKGVGNKKSDYFHSIKRGFDIKTIAGAMRSYPLAWDKVSKYLSKKLEIGSESMGFYENAISEAFSILANEAGGRGTSVYSLKSFAGRICGTDKGREIVKSVLGLDIFKNIWRFRIDKPHVIRFDLWKKINDKADPVWSMLIASGVIEDKLGSGSGYLNLEIFDISRADFILDRQNAGLNKNEIDEVFGILKNAVECREGFTVCCSEKKLGGIFKKLKIPIDNIEVSDGDDSFRKQNGASDTISACW